MYDKLGLENSVQCYYLFNYLDDKGYLSLDNNKVSRYINENKDSYYLDLSKDNLIASDMLFKKSLCRHEAPFFEDSLNNYGIKAYTLSCFMGETGKKYDIKNPNHSVVVSEDLGTMVFDTLNDNIYDKTSTTYADSDPYIYFSYNSNDFLYMMPDCSSNKKTNIICEKLTEKEIDAAKKIIDKMIDEDFYIDLSNLLKHLLYLCYKGNKAYNNVKRISKLAKQGKIKLLINIYDKLSVKPQNQIKNAIDCWRPESFYDYCYYCEAALVGALEWNEKVENELYDLINKGKEGQDKDEQSNNIIIDLII